MAGKFRTSDKKYLLIILVAISGVFLIYTALGFFRRNVTSTTVAPPGCYYDKVKCYQDPCPTVLVCPNRDSGK
ncbi:hypothetical protein A2Z33_05355 [Candidatus Gottesmanbacteria bacterium RBG_16_52_11]|uniref:Uncharacterized protein n=1 Tax=Candidatus Gottesmanbacteria bacterium RBG_16_52_11 TaxID=1798374 RepID=A0A1F5YN40_9BACT|nr:MAG: hypothetical protein A2Z33_05355 [Candidatus Gottesmanbacteria bacterium RBG_16_52_11]